MLRTMTRTQTGLLLEEEEKLRQAGLPMIKTASQLQQELEQEEARARRRDRQKQNDKLRVDAEGVVRIVPEKSFFRKAGKGKNNLSLHTAEAAAAIREATEEDFKEAERELGIMRKGCKNFFTKTMQAGAPRYPEWHPAKNPNSKWRQLAESRTCEHVLRPLIAPMPRPSSAASMYKSSSWAGARAVDGMPFSDQDDTPQGVSLGGMAGSVAYRLRREPDDQTLAIANGITGNKPQSWDDSQALISRPQHLDNSQPIITVTASADEPLHAVENCVNRHSAGIPVSAADIQDHQDAVARFLYNPRSLGPARPSVVSNNENPGCWKASRMVNWMSATHSRRQLAWAPAPAEQPAAQLTSGALRHSTDPHLAADPYLAAAA